MSRPKIRRKVCFKPGVTYFKPAGIPLINLQEVQLSYDELEALRLKNHLGMDQKEAAKKMNVSQPTFHRILLLAQKKVAECLVTGKAIRIETKEER